MLFLNTDNETLGGRPLAIATASSIGEALVVEEIDRVRGLNEPASGLSRGES